MRRLSCLWHILLCSLFLLTALSPALAQQQFQGVCARVKMVIAQELTLERIGFEARLEISNNDPNDPITDFSAALTFENPSLSTNGVVNDSSPLFFVRAPTYEFINSVNGDGVISPTATAVIKWFIIPKPSAGGTSPDGTSFQVGCRLSGKMRGIALPPEILQAFPATISVRPEPQLEITYFQPRDVQGDDPFTPEVESPIPFLVGVLVKNSGYGPAKSVKIDSQQPRIVENLQNLLLVAQLIGARVSDKPVQPTSLTVNLGDIPPGQTRKGAWDMLTSLSGEFVEFKASYTHASELGGIETSLIKSLHAYFISREVLNDQPGRDSLKDFLAISDNNPELIPNALYESEGNILPVNYMTNTAVVGSAGPGGSFTVTLSADKPGWSYLRLTDPGQAKIPIARVTRSDGKVLNPNNSWTNVRYTEIGNFRQSFLNIFDLVDIGTYSYVVTYGQISGDVTPPVMTMRFAGAASESGGAYYITPDTQIYFTAEDASPVNMSYSVTNGPFLPALPFTLPNPGTYFIRYYAVDSFGNRSLTNFNNVIVSGIAALDFAEVTSPVASMFVAGDALSIRPQNAPILFRAGSNPSRVDATLDIFQGVTAWATVSNVPSSPTTDTTASLKIGGDFVDLYKYKLDNGPWSSEFPVASPVALSGLGAGNHTLSVLGRSSQGSYLDVSHAATASWVVNASAPATHITGTPASPTRSRAALLNIAGTGVTAYKWTLNNSYFRPETNAPGALAIDISSATGQVVTLGVLGKVGGTFQPTNNPTTIQWLFDPLFGFAQPGRQLVRTVQFTNIGSATQTFSWDGKDNSGGIVSPGIYTVRITLVDQLGRTNFASRAIQVGELTGERTVLADSVRGPRNPYARNNWVVWQDQASGNSEIYVRNVHTNGAIIRLTTTSLSQENPRSDGRFVVWQGRQANGSWEIYLKDLTSTAAPVQITTNLNTDKINPAIDWPWVVYQRRASGAPSAAWQLTALNLVNGLSIPVWASGQDQLNPDVQAGRVVWQDWRDVGPGEIYFKDLESGEAFRVTTNTFGQYHPAVFDNWIVWQDNRATQLDLYGWDLHKNREVRLTYTPENETRPHLDGTWLTCLEDSLGALTQNLRLMHLPSRVTMPVTRSATFKERAALAGGKAVWLDVVGNSGNILARDIPALQSVFETRNAIVVTEAMAAFQQSAHKLLALWHAQAGVSEITIYNALLPQVSTQTVSWVAGAPSGSDFALTPGKFLWVKFADKRILDLGLSTSSTLNLAAGANVVSYTAFPSQYSAYALLRQIGTDKARAVRMLDAASGQWVVAEIQSGRTIGVDFNIPRVAVLMVDLVSPVNSFQPH